MHGTHGYCRYSYRRERMHTTHTYESGKKQCTRKSTFGKGEKRGRRRRKIEEEMKEEREEEEEKGR